MWTPLVSAYAHCLLSSHHEMRGTEGTEYPSTLGRTWLYLLVNLLIGTGRLLLGPLKTFFSPSCPGPSVSAHSSNAPAPSHLGSSPVCQHLYCFGVSKTEHYVLYRGVVGVQLLLSVSLPWTRLYSLGCCWALGCLCCQSLTVVCSPQGFFHMAASQLVCPQPIPNKESLV